MDNLLSLRRNALVYGLCLPIAILVGYLLARPNDFRTLAFIGLLMGVLTMPLLMRWHHAFLILSWNAALVVPFLPGQTSWWMCLSFISLGFAVLFRIITKRSDFVSAPSVTFWILVLFFTVLITAKLTGGVGARSIGSLSYGGKRYQYVVSAIVGYFALIGARIRSEQATTLAVGFFASGVTSAISEVAYLLGPKFYFLFNIFPAAFAAGLASGEQSSLPRFGGTSFAAQAAILALVARYGLRELFNLNRPWRLALLLLLIGVSLFGGYRSLLIVLLLFFGLQFYFERLASIRNLAVLAGVMVLLFTIAVGFGTKLPTSVQRTLSFLPIQVDDLVRRDSGSTSEWRWLMWKALLPEIPKYLLRGKGFAYNGTDMYLTEEAMRRGYYASYEGALVIGNYHNGILTVLIPFGLWGLIALTGFSLASIRVLYFNYKYGAPPLRTINTVLISWFLARFVMYLTIYGSFEYDLPFFVGMVGLSLSLNRGVRSAESAVQPGVEEPAQTER